MLHTGTLRVECRQKGKVKDMSVQDYLSAVKIGKKNIMRV